jgi:phage protein D
VLDFGRQLQVRIRGGEQIFDGRIMAIEADFTVAAPPCITILAEDRFQDLRMTRRTRSFERISDADIFRTIASDHSLTADVNLPGPTHKNLVQVNQSDLAFMRECARTLGAELWMEGSTLHVTSRNNRGNASVDLAVGGNLIDFRATADLASQRTALTVSGWDVAGKQAISYEATDSIISSELNGDNSGVSILQSALGERKETLAHTVPVSSDEAHTTAENAFRMMARRFVVAHGIADGNSQLRVGVNINVSGAGNLFNGKYYLVEVEHTYDLTHGYRTRFVAERPGIGAA